MRKGLPFPATASLMALIAGLVALQAQAAAPTSDAERRYVAPAATQKVADGPRTATLEPGYGRKFAEANTKPLVTISNPFLDPGKPLFARAEALQCLADGSVMVSGRAGFDANSRAMGTGFWRIAPDGAVTPLHTRSTDAYPLTPQTTCNASFAKSVADGPRFTAAPDGRIVISARAAVLAIATDGRVTRVAGPARSCADTSASLQGVTDGGAEQARFTEPERPVLDPEGNVWVADQKGCALRRISAAGDVTTVIKPDVLCTDAVPREDRPMLDTLAWDPVNGELVAAGSRTVATPVHNLYTTVFRIKPSGEFRRVLYATKVGKSPAKVGVDGVRAMAVDPKGRIHLVSLLMLFERRGWDALQLLRVDETGNAVVPLTGTKIRNGTWMASHPYDGAAELAWFEGTRDLCFSPDGMAFVIDDLLLRKLDSKGQVTTWAF